MISLPTWSRRCKHSNVRTMRKIVLFIGVAMTGCVAFAGNAGWAVPGEMAADSAKVRMELKADNNAGSRKPLELTKKRRELVDAELETVDEMLNHSDNKAKSNTPGSNSATAKKPAKPTNNTPKGSSGPSMNRPTYPGGNVAIREFVKRTQRYPQECKRERLRGRAEVCITVAPDGTPHSPKITKSSGNIYMDTEALRVAKLMPKWTPAAPGDSAKEVKHTIFLNFRPGR